MQVHVCTCDCRGQSPKSHSRVDSGLGVSYCQCQGNIKIELFMDYCKNLHQGWGYNIYIFLNPGTSSRSLSNSRVTVIQTRVKGPESW